MSNFVNIMDIIYPVGSIYQSMNATSPASSIGGTWTQLKTFLYGSTTAKQTGGEATHKLTVNEMPSHNHHITNKPAGNNFATNLPYQIGGAGLDSSNTFINKYVESEGGGKHTTTCHLIQPASSGTERRSCAKSERFKFKRGGVCLITLISWILSTPLGRYLFQTVASHQQAQSVEHGRNSIVIRLSAAARQIRLAAQTQLDLRLMKCRHTITNLLDLANGPRSLIRSIILKSLVMVSEIGIHQWIQWKVLAAISHLTTAQSIGLLTSISAQPSYMLGGVA